MRTGAGTARSAPLPAARPAVTHFRETSAHRIQPEGVEHGVQPCLRSNINRFLNWAMISSFFIECPSPPARSP